MARLRDDQEFRARVRAAVALQTPLSIFLGRVQGPGEPLWLPDDRDVVLAWHAYQDDSLCGQCGNPRELCHDPDLTGELSGHIEVCHITAAVARARKREWDRFVGQASDDVEVETAGAHVVVTRRPTT